jgi:tetratricopeptide (TPR) repeat protein
MTKTSARNKKSEKQPEQVTNVSGGVNVNADQVSIDGDVVGRDKITQNIRQLMLRPWAWLVGVVILAVALVLVAGIFNVGQLQALLPTPTPSPTPRAFSPAIEGQSLIIVADFDDRSNGRYKGIDPAQYIFEQLVAQTQKDKLNLRIERLHQVMDDSTARPTGKIYNATLVVWGWYDALTITPRIERIKTLSEYRSSEEGQHLSLSDPTKVEFSVVTDLSSQSTYLVLFALGLDADSDPARGSDGALQYFTSAIESLPTNVTVTTNPVEAYYFRGNAYLTKRDYDHAITDYDKAIQLKPDYADIYNNRGVSYYLKSDYDRAMADYDQAIQLNPDYAKAYNNRGNAYDDKGDHDHAIADYNTAIQLQPDYVNAYYNRGNAYYNKGDYDRAISDYTEAIQLQPGDAEAHNNRGNAYDNKGDFDRAIADFDQAIQLKPDYAKAYNNRGNAYYNKGNYDRAIADFDQAIQLKPDYAEAHNNRGNAYDDKGDHDHAIADYNTAIQLQPDYVNAYYNRGLAYGNSGEIDKAIADFKKVLELSSDPAITQLAQDELNKLGVK